MRLSALSARPVHDSQTVILGPCQEIFQMSGNAVFGEGESVNRNDSGGSGGSKQDEELAGRAAAALKARPHLRNLNLV